MTKDELIESLATARAQARRPEAPYADLRGADLRGADLWGADLRDAGILIVRGLPSGDVQMVPTVDGWQLRVGCWEGDRDALRELISQDEGWPEARGKEVARRRPSLEALLMLADDHAERNALILAGIVEKWGEKA